MYIFSIVATVLYSLILISWGSENDPQVIEGLAAISIFLGLGLSITGIVTSKKNTKNKPSHSTDSSRQLESLFALKEKGAIDEYEYNKKKNEILNGSNQE